MPGSLALRGTGAPEEIALVERIVMEHPRTFSQEIRMRENALSLLYRAGWGRGDDERFSAPRIASKVHFNNLIQRQ